VLHVVMRQHVYCLGYVSLVLVTYSLSGLVLQIFGYINTNKDYLHGQKMTFFCRCFLVWKQSNERDKFQRLDRPSVFQSSKWRHTATDYYLVAAFRKSLVFPQPSIASSSCMSEISLTLLSEQNVN